MIYGNLWLSAVSKPSEWIRSNRGGDFNARYSLMVRHTGDTQWIKMPDLLYKVGPRYQKNDRNTSLKIWCQKYTYTVKSRFNEWPLSSHLNSLNWDFMLHRDFFIWNSSFVLMIEFLKSRLYVTSRFVKSRLYCYTGYTTCRILAWCRMKKIGK